MCRYTKCLRIIKFSRADIHFIFIFMSRLSYYPLLSMSKLGRNGITFETTSSHDDMMICFGNSFRNFQTMQNVLCYVLYIREFQKWLTRFCTESQDRTKSRFRPGNFKNLWCHLKTYLVSWIFSKACFPTAERYLNCLRFLSFGEPNESWFSSELHLSGIKTWVSSFVQLQV